MKTFKEFLNEAKGGKYELTDELIELLEKSDE